MRNQQTPRTTNYEEGNMNAFVKLLFSLFIFNYALSQHQLPFESKDNSIQLSVRNTSTVAASGMKVELGDTPGWLHFA